MPKPFGQMPGPKGLPIIGNVLAYSRFGKHSFDRLHLAKLENYARYGKIYKEKLGPGTTIVQVFSPESAGVVFRSSGPLPVRPPMPITVAAHRRDGWPLGLGSLNGPAWLSLRRAVNRPMMRPAAVLPYLPAQNAVADDFVSLLRSSVGVSKRTREDLYDIMLRYAMEAIGAVCFSARLGVLSSSLTPSSPPGQLLASTQHMFDAVQRSTFAFPWYFWFRTALYRQFIDGKTGCTRVASAYVRSAMEAMPQGNQPHDNDDTEGNLLRTLMAIGSLSEEDLVTIVMDLFIAGIDSTANALCFAIYNLSRNPDQQERLAEEVRDRVGDTGPVTAYAINQMSYLKACVKESFRLNFPIEGGTTRILEKDTEIDGYLIPKGTFISLNNQTMCLQEEYFDRPLEYLPERWLKDGSAALRPPPNFVMLPFGYGPRMCIGRRFAEQEIYLALIKLIQNFRMVYRNKEPIGMLNRVFTKPDAPLDVLFYRRE